MKRAAFFDIDGTLIACYSQKLLMQNLYRHDLLSVRQVMRIWLWFFLYKLGFASESSELRRLTYSTLTRRPKIEIDYIFLETVENILKNFRLTKMWAVVDSHKSSGDMIFAISSSLKEMCVPIANSFGIENVFSTDLEVINGFYSGAWVGKLLEGDEKLLLIKNLAQQYNINLSDSAAYADSFSDLPMLTAVGRPVVVNPDPQLLRFATRKKWRIISNYV